MRRRSKFSAIILTLPGTKLPSIPAELKDYVSFEKVEGEYDGSPLEIQAYDEFRVYHATAGFSPKGSVRLKTRDLEGCITWITGKDVHQIIGILNGKPEPSLNRELCPACHRLTGRRTGFKSQTAKPQHNNRIYYKCQNCGKLYYFQRPIRRQAKKKEPLGYDEAVIRKSTKPRVAQKRLARI